MARRFQRAEEDAGEMSGYRIRITESAGTAMSILLPSTNPWGPQHCERPDCVTCHLGDERLINCGKRNILYESECTLCEEYNKAGKGKDDHSLQEGVYMLVNPPGQFMNGPRNMNQTGIRC